MSLFWTLECSLYVLFQVWPCISHKLPGCTMAVLLLFHSKLCHCCLPLSKATAFCICNQICTYAASLPGTSSESGLWS
jgi:hypothetical protein